MPLLQQKAGRQQARVFGRWFGCLIRFVPAGWALSFFSGGGPCRGLGSLRVNSLLFCSKSTYPSCSWILLNCWHGILQLAIVIQPCQWLNSPGKADRICLLSGNPVAPVFLGFVQGIIGLFPDGVRRIAALKFCNTKADGEACSIGQDEFLAAKAGCHIFIAAVLAQDAVESFQDGIAFVVAKVVVDSFEVVQVCHEQAEGFSVAVAKRDAFMETRVKVTAVGQPGEFVCLADALEFFLGGFQFPDVVVQFVFEQFPGEMSTIVPISPFSPESGTTMPLLR